MKSRIVLTEKQTRAYELLQSSATHIFLYGGARSGKTFVFLLYLIIQSLQYSGLWSLIARLKYSHIKSSIWKQSLLPLLNKTGLTEGVDYILNKSDLEVEFFNGSKISLAGLDSEERIDKVLGLEYNIIYLNEISQISYDIVANVRPRLARKIRGFQNKYLYDCNPPSPRHWAHKEFLEKVNPRTGKPLKHKNDYASLLINPGDNKANLSRQYLRVLDNLPDKERKRFRDGLWVKPEGMVIHNFSDELVIDKLPDGYNRYVFTGVDFGLNMAIVYITELNGFYYILTDYGAYGMTSAQFNREAGRKMSWNIAYCDPSGGERIKEIDYGTKADNSVEDGLDFIIELINQGRFKIHRSATGILSTIYDYRRDDKGRLIKENDHYIDAMRYGLYTYHKQVGERHTLKDIILGRDGSILNI